MKGRYEGMEGYEGKVLKGRYGGKGKGENGR